MKKTITSVTCDRCGKDINHANDKYMSVTAYLTGKISKGSSYSGGGACFDVEMDLCKPCVQSFEDWKSIKTR